MGAVMAVVSGIPYQRDTPSHRRYQWPLLCGFCNNSRPHILHINGVFSWITHLVMDIKQCLWNYCHFSLFSLGSITCVT